MMLNVDEGRQIGAMRPPCHSHFPVLLQIELSDKQFIWIQADSPAEPLWTTEQLIKSNSAGAIISWLPKVRPAQLWRVQVCAQSCETPVFLCRPESAQYESSAAPLRVHASTTQVWELKVNILKRKGPSHEQTLVLNSVPVGLASILTPRLFRPSSLIRVEVPHAMGRPIVVPRTERALA